MSAIELEYPNSKQLIQHVFEVNEEIREDNKQELEKTKFPSPKKVNICESNE